MAEHNSPDASRLHLGVAYYPEHWPEERWPEDIRLMREAGFSVVRMAEFAWSTLEPAAGEFRLDWLERAIAALAEAGIVSVLGTPTAGPPAWLTQTDPSMLAVDEYGRRVQHGNRCHYCVNSPEFHDAARRIVGAMAERFGPNPHVIGWQMDNEYNRVCYCDRCASLFRQYLAEKFGSLDALNEHWSTAYWSQTYSAWEQVPIPIGAHNPGLMLEFKRFITHSYRRFQRLQLDVLRPHLRPGVWATHNFMGWYDGYDHYELNADLDLASWDWYVGSGHHDYLTSGAIHDLTRGFSATPLAQGAGGGKPRNFWVIETQPGCVNWAPVNTMLNKGETRVMAWHAIAHGADAILYWQWRSALGGQEQYHGSLLDQSGRPRPFYEEVQQLGRDLAAISALLADSKPAARAAIINSYDSRWSIQWQRHHRDFDYVAHFNHYYRPLAAQNIAVDVISADAPLDGYRLVIVPALLMLNASQAARLAEFVTRRQGHLVLTARCGMKDEHNALFPARQPGPLASLAGVEVEEYYALDEPVPVKGNWFAGVSRLWAERLKVLDEKSVVAIARYGSANGWLDDQLAITVRGAGHGGLVYYVGAYLDDVAQQAFLDHLVKNAVVKPVMETPPGVEARKRANLKGEEIYIIINHEQEDKRVPLPWPAREHLSGETGRGDLMLAPYGIAVLTPIS